MERRIPWPRFALEVVVIVVSILLAFAIDAWWEGRQELETGRKLVAAVVEEATANRRLVERVIRLVEEHQAATRRLYLMSDDDLREVHADTALALVGSMLIANTYELQQGALSAANDAEGRRLIRDPNARDALADLQGKIDDLDERFQILAEMSQRGLLALSRHPLYQARYLGGRESLAPTVDLRAIRDDIEVLAAATAMQRTRDVYLGVLGELLATLDATVTAVTQGP